MSQFSNLKYTDPFHIHGSTVISMVIHTLEDTSKPPDSRWCLQLDFRNAFNSIDRSCMFQEVRSHVPLLSRWIESCYGSHPLLLFGNHTVLSQCGVQQGDPLGPLCFALTLQPIVECIRREVPGLAINVWYLDDGTLIGSPDDLSLALKIIEEDGPLRGLHLNRSKSLLIIPGDGCDSVNPLPAEIPVSREGFCLLGCPIGSSPFCEAFLLDRVAKIKASVGRLCDLEDSQMETTLLRSCLSLPKFIFALRTCPPNFITRSTASFDEVMREALADIAGGPLTDWSWQKATLPSSLGGLNLRLANQHAPAAYVSSVSECGSLAAMILGFPLPPPPLLSDAISSLANGAAKPEWLTLDDIDVPLHQRHLSHAIDEASFNLLLESAPDTRSRALALSSSLPHAGDWLNVVPSQTLGLNLQNQEFRLCLDYWLGLKMSNAGTICRLCSRQADSFGDHQVGCGGNGDRIHRHDSIRDVFFSAAQSAALAPRKEVPSLIPASNSRPADIFLPNWSRGRPAAIDVTVISTMQPLTLAGAAASPGYALQVAEDRKMAAHFEACRAVGVDFVPVTVESLGGWSEEAIANIKKIGRLLGQRTGSPPGDSIRHLFQRLSISLW